MNQKELEWYGFSVREKTDESGNKKETKVNSEGEIEEERIAINSIPIINLNNHNWDRMNTKINSSYEVDENGNLVYSDGYTLYCNKRVVLNVVFNENYTENVIGGIKVGTDLKEVEKTLGTPTFKGGKYIGYKTIEDYFFFTENEISVYPNLPIDNEDFEILVNDYYTKRRDIDRTDFLIEIRNNFEDFLIDLDEEKDIVTISSTIRNVTVKLNNLGNIEPEFYSGYKYILDETTNYVNTKDYKKTEEDLVEIKEVERINGR